MSGKCDLWHLNFFFYPHILLGEIDELLPVGAKAVEVERLSLPAEVVVGVLLPLQDGTECPAGLHRRLQFAKRVVRQQGHGDVVKEPLAERLVRRTSLSKLQPDINTTQALATGVQVYLETINSAPLFTVHLETIYSVPILPYSYSLIPKWI